MYDPIILSNISFGGCQLLCDVKGEGGFHHFPAIFLFPAKVLGAAQVHAKQPHGAGSLEVCVFHRSDFVIKVSCVTLLINCSGPLDRYKSIIPLLLLYDSTPFSEKD